MALRRVSCGRLETRSWSREINQFYIRALLYPFEDNFMSVLRDIEILNIEIRREIGQLSFDTCVQVNEPEILVLEPSSEGDERVSARQEGQVSSTASQG